MKNSNAILGIMMGDHALIEVLFMVFKEKLDKDIDSARKSFDEFKWELQKHIFVEEKVIFIICDLPGSETCKIVQRLMRDHDIMLEMLNKTENDLAANNETDVSGFQELLTSHRDIEEKILYPKLDQQLSETQKEIVVARINEIPLKKGEE